MKWLTGFLAVAFLAGMLIAVPSGCGEKKASEIDASKVENPQPKGHEQAYQNSQKPPAKK